MSKWILIFLLIASPCCGETFGYTTVGGSNESVGADEQVGLGPFSPSESGWATSISLYGADFAGDGRGYVAGIWADSAGSPSSILVQTGYESLSGGLEWQTFDLTEPYYVTSGTDYWLGYNHDGNAVQIHYNAVGGFSRHWDPDTFVSGTHTLENYNSGGSTGTKKYSIYVTYEPDRFTIKDGVKFREGSKYVDYCADADAIGCWRFNGTEGNSLIDESGQNHHCVNSGATFQTSNCKEDECYDIDTDTDEIACGDIGELDEATTQFSFAVWLYHDTINTDDYIFNKYDGDGILVFRDDDSSVSSRTDVYRITIFDSADASTVTLESNQGSTPQGEWVHFAFTWDENGTDTLRMYINGEEVDDSPDTSGAIAALDSGTAEVKLCSSSGASLDGECDEAILLDRVLTPAEVKDLYENGMR